jgi:hypothetical protein
VLTRVVDDTASVCSHIQQEIQGPITPAPEPAEAAEVASLKSESQVQAQG